MSFLSRQIENDRNYQFPKESIKALAELGLLGLMIPKKFGGLGENHICYVALVEALARYGCPSTAMIFSQSYLFFLFYTASQFRVTLVGLVQTH